ncbi:MAG: hypothetical protein FIA99_18490 [Ruminiclostridium sp.]|nr:hypothetical protein [Ruminiclostridium sp.]
MNQKLIRLQSYILSVVFFLTIFAGQIIFIEKSFAATQSRTFTKTIMQTINYTYLTNPWTTVSSVASPSTVPTSYSINEDGYTGSIPRTSFVNTTPWHMTGSASSPYPGRYYNYYQSVWTATYNGTLTKTVPDPTPTPTPVPTPTPTPVPLSDLVITSLSWSPTSPITGNNVSFTATVKNQGSGTSPNGVIHGVSFRVDGTEVAWSTSFSSSLAPGASTNITAGGWSATVGTHTVNACVDVAVQRISESNESNNWSSNLTMNVTNQTPTPTPTPTPNLPQSVTITYPISNGNYNRGNITAAWDAISGASYLLYMRDLTVNMLILDGVSAGTTNLYNILSKYFYEGHKYRITVKATVGSSEVWGDKSFNINLSDARQEIIDRGNAMIGYSWTPAQSVRAWRDNLENKFLPGVTYSGIPYSQTAYQCSISSVSWPYGSYFDSKLNDSSSGFYDDYTRFDPPIIMPKYGNDCSGYTSICWNINRETTVGIATHSRVGKTSETYLKQYARMSPGDAFVVSGSHTFVLERIEAVNDSSGNLIKLKFICNEQTPYNSRERIWYSNDCSNDGYISVSKNSTLAQDYTWDWQ